MTPSRFSSIDAPIKVVIWDLDETFWNGTLSEGGITAYADHIAMVRTLVDRGIMCAICSKNDFDTARAKLEELGIWDAFVFSHIDWTPKGQAVQSILARMGLRDENALFLDDNALNLEEVKFFSPRIACVDATGSTDGSAADLTGLLDLPQLQGKPDPDHSRLEQYRVLEAKESDLKAGDLSNEEFLRQSDIKVRLVTDFDDHMDRVLELINRTNQLNFTKERVTTEEQKQSLIETLRIPGIHAGLVEVRDRYGDYGMVGFFCIRMRFDGTTVHHFAFSCRTLNMGVEQWVWDHLGRPAFDVLGPVANALDTPQTVDWITHVDDFGASGDAATDRHLCLVGGCDLQQVSFYCGSQRDEFVNKPDDDGIIVRYDDAGFVLNPRDPALKNNYVLRNIVGHTLEEMEALDASLASSDIIILSMLFAFLTNNMFTYEAQGQTDRYLTTLPPKRLSGLVRNPQMAIRMLRTLHHLKLDQDAHLDLIQKCFEKAASTMKPGARLFILGTTSSQGAQAARSSEPRAAYNAMCRTFCEATPGAFFIDVDALIPAEEFFDSDHYTRKGYFKIAQFINANAAADQVDAT
jgi:FkbH-like protein